MDNLTKAQRSYNMSRIRSSNTKLEIKFFNLLDKNNIKYVKHPKLYGKPDCKIENLLVFIDSDFWHGWKFSQWKDRLPKKYWVEKIERNIHRDKQKTSKLRRMGFKVIRIWGHNIQNEVKTLDRIQRYL
jgi:DNA mismatch endonuclease (patch repair protein)